MKYYKNLIKRKKYNVLIAILIVFILGLFLFYSYFLDVIIRNIAWSDLSYYAIDNNGIVGIIGSTNIGVSFIGICLMYVGIVWLPLNSPDAQDDSDYDIKSDGENIYIKFKKNEFLVKKETFQPTDLFFKDKNGRFVSSTRGYQIYNYVSTKYKELTEKEVDTSKIILKSEVVNKFSNVQKMSNEEKLNFIKQQKLKNKPRWFFIITSILLWANFILWYICLLSYFDLIISNTKTSIINMII